MNDFDDALKDLRFIPAPPGPHVWEPKTHCPPMPGVPRDVDLDRACASALGYVVDGLRQQREPERDGWQLLRCYSAEPATINEMLAWLQRRGAVDLQANPDGLWVARMLYERSESSGPCSSPNEAFARLCVEVDATEKAAGGARG